jgi:hypothetical protein
MLQIQWHDRDPATGQRRFLRAERFAGEWRFFVKLERRVPWTAGQQPTRAMWEHVLDSLRRRYRRREGVEDEDLEQVEKILAEVIRLEELRNS